MDREKTFEALDVSQLKESSKDELYRRLAYVKAVESSSCALARESLEAIIQSVGHTRGETPPSWYTVYRWVKKFRSSGRKPAALVPYQKSSMPRKSRLDPKVEHFLEEAISGVYLNRRKCSMMEVWRYLQSAIVTYNREHPSSKLDCPSYRTVATRINTLNEYEKVLARDGYLEARHKFRTSYGGRPVSRPLERVEIDHTVLDLYVLEDETGLIAGRPTLTTALDSRTRCLLGYYLEFDPPSSLSVAECLKAAILPKDWVKETSPMVQGDWMCCGLPECVVVDNGPEFHGELFSNACVTLGIAVQHTPPRAPWLKGQVERYFKTVNDGLVHRLPGSTHGKKIYPQGFKPQNDACIPFSVFRSLLHVWIVDVYHQRAHRSLNNSPHQEWLKFFDFQLPLRGFDAGDIFVALAQSEQRMLSHKGIEFQGLFYNSRQLSQVYRREGKKKVTFKVNVSDISMIAVFDPPSGGYLYVPAVKFEYAKRKTMWQHKVIRRFQREHLRDGKGEVCLVEAENTIRAMIDSVSTKEGSARVHQRRSRFKQRGKSVGPSLEIKPAKVCGETEDVEHFYKSHKGWNGNFMPE